MLVITRHAEEKLLHFLETIETDFLGWRAVVFTSDAALKKEQEEVRFQLVIDLIEHKENTRVFFFENHVIVLCTGHTKEALETLKTGLMDMLASADKNMATSSIIDLSVKFEAFKQYIHTQLIAEQARQDEQNKKETKAPRPISVDITHARKILATRASRAGFYVQLAEDDMFTLHLVERIFGDYTVVKSMDGVEAVETYMLNAPDIIFLDINMPEMDGHEALEKILAFDPDAFVVMLTGNSYMKDISRAMKAGAKGFVTKPFPKEKLLNYIGMCQKNKE